MTLSSAMVCPAVTLVSAMLGSARVTAMALIVEPAAVVATMTSVLSPSCNGTAVCTAACSYSSQQENAPSGDSAACGPSGDGAYDEAAGVYRLYARRRSVRQCMTSGY